MVKLKKISRTNNILLRRAMLAKGDQNLSKWFVLYLFAVSVAMIWFFMNLSLANATEITSYCIFSLVVSVVLWLLYKRLHWKTASLVILLVAMIASYFWAKQLPLIVDTMDATEGGPSEMSFGGAIIFAVTFGLAFLLSISLLYFLYQKLDKRLP